MVIYTLGSDKSSDAKMMYLSFCVLMCIFYGALYVNGDATLQMFGVFGFIAMTTGIMAYLVDQGNKGKIEWLDTVTEEDKSLRWSWLNTDKWTFLGKNPGWKGDLLIMVVIVVFTAWQITSTQSLITGSPVFGTVSISGDPYLRAFVTGLAGTHETVLFFGLLFPMAYAYAAYKTKNPMLALILAIMFTCIVFGAYHWRVYGLEQISATKSVMFYAFTECIMVHALRSCKFNIARHFTNNFLAVLIPTLSVMAI